MCDYKRLNEAISDLDITGCISAIGSNHFKDATGARKFLDEIRHSDCLVIRYPKTSLDQKKESFVTGCLEILEDFPDLKSEMLVFGKQAQQIQSAFREILIYLDAKLQEHFPTPAIQAWAVIYCAEERLKGVQFEVKKHFLNDLNGLNIGSSQILVKNRKDQPYDPDSVMEATIRNLSISLVMFSYRYEWVSKSTKEHILPPPVQIPKETVRAANLVLNLALVWENLEIGWDRVRLFGGEIKSNTVMGFEVLLFPAPTQLERDAFMAENRSTYLMTQQSIAYMGDESAHTWIDPLESKNIPFAPESFISIEEFSAKQILENVWGWNLSDRDGQFGIPLSHWIRGYAYLKSRLGGGMNMDWANPVSFKRDELISRLSRVGFTNSEADRFISAITFDKRSRDLYDTPLIRRSDGKLYLCSFALIGSNIINILISRVSSLNSNIDGKGTRFEKQVLATLQEFKLEPKGFKYSVNGKPFDCDAAFILDRKLFLYECKNFLFPKGHMPAIYFFGKKIEGADRQVLRNQKHFSEDPKIVKNQFGNDAEWDEIVPCVLQALPWSSIFDGKVYHYDRSALERYLTGAITVSSSTKGASKEIYSLPLRKGSLITADGLIEEMKNPLQIKIEAKDLKLHIVPIPIPDKRLFVLPTLWSTSRTMNERLEAVGIPSEKVESIIAALDQERKTS